MIRKTMIIKLEGRPAGLEFKTPQSALERWDPTLVPMKAAAPSENEISILGQIGKKEYGGISSGMVKEALAAMNGAPLRVVLNSPGGDAVEGIAIYNLLAEHKANVTMHVIGQAASAASVIAMAGDRIEMGEASLMMIHEGMGLVMGQADDMIRVAEFLKLVNATVAELYASRSGQKVDDVLAMMKKETWMSAVDAVSKGFADIALRKDSKKKPAAMAAMAALKQSLCALNASQSLAAASGEMPRFAVQMSSQSSPASRDTRKPVSLNEGTKMKIKDQITSYENRRAAHTARMDAIMEVAGTENRTLKPEEQEEYDTLDGEVEQIDSHLVRLRKQESRSVSTARTVDMSAAGGEGADKADPDKSSGQRGDKSDKKSQAYITVTPNVEKAIPFTRYAMAMARARGNTFNALQIAKNNQRWHDQTPEVEQILMAAVAAGDTNTAGWASELAYAQNLVGEFVNFLRPQTIIGRVPMLRNVPFNVRVGSQNSGSSAFWVGQGKPVPVSKLGTGAVTLGIAKAAGLVVLDEELVRNSQPSAELLVRDDLGAAVAQFTDVQFIDPAVAAVANVSPASITNLVEPIAASGTAATNFRADLLKLIQAVITQNIDPRGAVLIMTPSQALAISMMLSTNAVPIYPALTMNGGSLQGIPVVTSMSAQLTASPSAGEGGMIILAVANEIMLADDGQVTIDASREAALEMLDNPTNQSTTGSVTATSMVSMFQTNSVAIKAVRFINWAKRRANIVAYIKDAAYTG